MHQSKLGVEVVKLSEKAAIVNLRGEVTGAAEDTLTKACEQARGEGIRSILLNFAGTTWLNSAGVSVLVKQYVQSKRLGQELMAIGLTNRHEEIFRLTGLDRAVRKYEGETEALAAAEALAKEESRRGKGSAVQPSGKDKARLEDHWAEYAPKLKVRGTPPKAVNLNVEGRRAVGPVEGFGQLWEKTYQLRLPGSSVRPVEVIKTLKDTFPELQPQQNRFYPPPSGIGPGEIVLINASTPGGPVATGVLVSYADDESFTLMTPQGHPESGWVTFSAFQENGTTVCQIQGLARANDPVYEIAFRLAGAKVQERIWTHVLASLAQRLGAEAHVQIDKACLDPGLQWSQARNVWYNAQIRTVVHAVLSPFRRVGSLFRR